MLVLTVWPLFALICLGFGLSRSLLQDRAFWQSAERLNYVILFPALLIATLSDAPVTDPAIARLGAAAIATIGIAATVLGLVRRLRPMPAARFGPALQGVVRFNTYLGLAITGSLLAEPGLQRAAVLLAIAVPLVNVLSVIALTDARGSAASLLYPLIRNPLILGCAIGIAIALTGWGLPLGTDRVLGLLAQASLPLGLLCVGAALRPDSMRGDLRTLGTICAARLVAMPVMAAAVAWGLGLGPAGTTILIVFSAIPTAPTAYVLTQQLGGDGRLMAGLITVQTILSVLTIPVMLGLLGIG